ncbi:MAG TPA: HlyC/CorC family transporter [Flavobacteriaceae bacterium]|nr:HlyC/CorC family transporter [Flavobacteriaceae bacterium]HIP26167.1 HlyC/CorC family transporter [Flavobacteriaceae bacterium]
MEIQLLIIFLSIIASAFFSGMEIAFVSASKIQIQIDKQQGTFLSKILAKLTKKPSVFITAMLIGNNVALVIYGYFMGELLIQFIEPYISNSFVVLLTQTFISTIVILITAEFLPKAIFRIFANEALRFFSIPAYIFYVLFYFISIFIGLISNFILKIFFNTEEDNVSLEFSKKELGNYISEQLETNTDEDIDSEIQIFQNALDFHNVKAREIMVPRTEIIALDVHDSLDKLKATFIETGFSKILIFKTSLDNIIGYVTAFDLFKKQKSIRTMLRLVDFVPESMTTKNILENLSKKKKSVAIVLDEYGGTSGLITKEDIIEELFGEIEDEHDNVVLTEEKINGREYLFSARLEIDYINETYDLNLPKEDAYETLGGFIVNFTENIPQLNEVFLINNFEITIKKVSSSKIDEIYLKIKDIED